MEILIKRTNLKRSVFVILTVVFFCSHQGVFGADLTFERDLALGFTGQDVKELQVFLNRDTYTRLADSGAGSPGRETEYFGPITKNAVVRFQEKYSSEILAPLGLRRGTGYFGPSSRSKAEDLLSKKEPQVINTNEDDEEDKDESEEVFKERAFHLENKDELDELLEGSDVRGFEYLELGEVVLMRPSKYQGEIGSELFLYGQGFTALNTVHFGDVSMDVQAESSDTIKMRVPHEIDRGYHEIEVENKFGRTKGESAFFVVTDENSTPPRIDSVEPQSGAWGSEVTIYGEGFDREWNMLRTPFGVIEGIPSDDTKSLTFSVEPFPEAMDPGKVDLPEENEIEDTDIFEGVDEEMFDLTSASREWEMRFYLVNDEGISKDPGVFIFKL